MCLSIYLSISIYISRCKPMNCPLHRSVYIEQLLSLICFGHSLDAMHCARYISVIVEPLSFEDCSICDFDYFSPNVRHHGNLRPGFVCFMSCPCPRVQFTQPNTPLVTSRTGTSSCFVPHYSLPCTRNCSGNQKYCATLWKHGPK